jgi:nitroreductase
MKVSKALKSRISCRAFLPDPVFEQKVRQLLDMARRAPSGGNLQPWHIHALSGPALASLVADVKGKITDTPRGEPPEYRIYPENLKDPYEARRVKCGEDMYASIGIAREDRPGRLAQFKRNFELFGAPVGLFVYIDKTMGPPQWSDTGMFLQSLMLYARELGLHTCAQESWSLWQETVGEHLNPPDHQMLFCGMALGFMDKEAPINTVRTERAPVDEFARFSGFDVG